MSVSVIVRDVRGNERAKTPFYNPLSLIKMQPNQNMNISFQFNLKIYSVTANAYTYIPAIIKPAVSFSASTAVMLGKTNCQNKDQKPS